MLILQSRHSWKALEARDRELGLRLDESGWTHDLGYLGETSYEFRQLSQNGHGLLQHWSLGHRKVQAECLKGLHSHWSLGHRKAQAECLKGLLSIRLDYDGDSRGQQRHASFVLQAYLVVYVMIPIS